MQVSLLAINDFHGNLELPAGGLPEINAVTRELTRTPSGGVARMATVLEGLRAQHKHFAFVSAGDLVGASPLASGYFDDEPAIDAMNNLGLDLNGVGNHEFDRGVAELRRLQSGGCPREGCKSGQPFAGAKFQFLAANVTVRDTGKTLFAPYALREFGGVRVAFIGVTLRSTPAILSPKAVAGLDFHDEADTVNKLVPELQQAGVEAIVVLIHQGGFQRGGPNDCIEFRGPIIDLVKRFDRAVDVVVGGGEVLQRPGGGQLLDGRGPRLQLLGLVLGALEEGREVRDGASATHRDFIDHLAAVGFDEAIELLGQGFDLGGRDILTSDEHVLVERHRLDLPLAVSGPEPPWPAGPSRDQTRTRQGAMRARTIHLPPGHASKISFLIGVRVDFCATLT